jgi:quinol monooxygenase YgiN
MAFEMINTWTAKQGKADALLGELTELLASTRTFDGCEMVEVYRDVDDPRFLILVERWSSEDRFEAYQACGASRAPEGQFAT